MALSYIVDPLIEHQNRAGVNNVDGWFEVFLQDTDDHAEVYLDFEGTRAPEQIRIDNNGRAVMIAEENVPYRVEMYDATGNLIYTQYPVYTMASGGGQLVTNLESTNGTVQINRTAVGSVVNYDLSVMDNDLTALPWLRCSGSTSMSGNVYRPEYVEGVMAVGSRGIVLRGGQYYHVDVHARCTKGSPVEYYDTVTVELVKEGEEDVPVTVASTAWVVDCTTSSTESVGLSADVMANADCELVVKITPTLANQNTFALTDVSAHRVYTGLPWRTEGGGLELGETATTAYRGDRGKAAYDHSLVTSGNPHNVTKGDVGLGNVENKSGAALKTEFTGAVTEGGTGFPTGGDVYTALSGKVDKEQGKGLSSNDFTDAYKTKLDDITVGAVAQGDTGFPTGGDVYTAIENNGKGVAVFDIELVSYALPSSGLPTFSDINAKVNAGFDVVIRTINEDLEDTYEYYKLADYTFSNITGIAKYYFSNVRGNTSIISVDSAETWDKSFKSYSLASHYHGNNSTTGITSSGTAPSGVTGASQKVMLGNGSWVQKCSLGIYSYGLSSGYYYRLATLTFSTADNAYAGCQFAVSWRSHTQKSGSGILAISFSEYDNVSWGGPILGRVLVTFARSSLDTNFASKLFFYAKKVTNGQYIVGVYSAHPQLISIALMSSGSLSSIDIPSSATTDSGTGITRLPYSVPTVTDVYPS